MASLAGKVVMVTGASSGIGEGIALHLASRGARLSLFSRRADQLERVANACKANGTSDTEVCFVAGDVTKDEDRQTLISQTKQRFGQLDALVNNAGIVRYQRASDITAKDYEDVFNTNLKATVFLTQLAIPHLKQTKGNIVHNSSVVASIAVPGIAIYCMTKAALDMYTQCLALDLAPHGVRVNSINPGGVTTDIWRNAFGEQVDENAVTEVLDDITSRYPFKRFATPLEVAKAVGFLVSDDASYISGHHLYVDGARQCFSGEP